MHDIYAGKLKGEDTCVTGKIACSTRLMAAIELSAQLAGLQGDNEQEDRRCDNMMEIEIRFSATTTERKVAAKMIFKMNGNML